MSDRLVHYVQLTLGPAHLARIRALDAVPGYRCRGIQLASSEATRSYEPTDEESALYSTVMAGTYEELPRGELVRRACALIDDARADAIIIDQPADLVQYRLARHVKRRGGLAFTRWAATWDDNPRARWKELLKRLVYRGFDGYLVTGARARAYVRTFGVPESRIFVCGNPVDVDALELHRANRGDADREESFLYVGRFLAYKNLEQLAGGYRRYRETGGTWSLTLVGFGEGGDGVKARLDGVPGVSMPGHLQLPALAELYRTCGALVLCSYEPWGLVVNEAMHMGAPVLLAETVGCVPELLDEGRNGFLLDGFSEQSIADAMHRMAGASNEARRAMSQASREIIGSHGPADWAEAAARGLDAAFAARGA